jgi:hypothetical protein
MRGYGVQVDMLDREEELERETFTSDPNSSEFLAQLFLALDAFQMKQ